MIISNLSHMTTIAQENGIQGQGHHKYEYYYHQPIEKPEKPVKPVKPSFSIAIAIATATAVAVGGFAFASASAVAVAGNTTKKS